MSVVKDPKLFIGRLLRKVGLVCETTAVYSNLEDGGTPHFENNSIGLLFGVT